MEGGSTSHGWDTSCNCECPVQDKLIPPSPAGISWWSTRQSAGADPMVRGSPASWNPVTRERRSACTFYHSPRNVSIPAADGQHFPVSLLGVRPGITRMILRTVGTAPRWFAAVMNRASRYIPEARNLPDSGWTIGHAQSAEAGMWDRPRGCHDPGFRAPFSGDTSYLYYTPIPEFCNFFFIQLLHSA